MKKVIVDRYASKVRKSLNRIKPKYAYIIDMAQATYELNDMLKPLVELIRG